MFGAYCKKLYLCIRFPKGSTFLKKRSLIDLDMNKQVVQAYIFLYRQKKETVNT